MITSDDIVHYGDKIDVNGKAYILAQVQANLFTLIDMECGNRLCDPFPCMYGTRLRSGNTSEDDIQLYGSFTLQDLHDAVASQCGDSGDDKNKYKYKVLKRFCHESVFERLAVLWNKKVEA